MLSKAKFMQVFKRDYSDGYEWNMYWESQYSLYARGYRGVNLHDITLEIMGR